MINKPRLLRADEIEVRVAHSVGDKKCHLLYIDSRAVTKYLDEWVGWNNWQTEFYPVNNQIVGKMGIWDETKNMWIWKSDVGSESNIEAEKGLISDCYKRMLVRFGVTELYSAPDILLPDDGFGNKGYKVSEIDYNDNREITHLVIVNRFNKEIYRWDKGATPQVAQNSPKTPSKSNLEILTEFCRQVKTEENINIVELTKFYNHYAGKINAGEFKGNIQPSKLWEKWGGARYNANITVPC